MRKKKGMALVMALYVTAIVFSLAAFFITDQFHKSKIVADSQDEKLALEAANMGLAYVVNYLGDVKLNWYDSFHIGYTPPGGMLTKADRGTAISYSGNELDIVAARFGQPAPGGNQSLLANVYTFSLKDLIKVSPVEKKSAEISGTLTLLYPKADADVNDPQALSSVGLDITAAVVNAAGHTVAAREIQWSGRRILNLAQVYQCWNCWDIPGAKPPNITDGTDNKNYIGNGYANNAGIAALSKNPGSSTDYSTSSLQSPYGTDQNGNITVGAYDLSKYNNPASAPVLNGAILAENKVTNGAGSAAGTINGTIAGQNVSIPLPSGESWGTFDPASSAPAQNAPQAMSRAFAAAATDGACSSGIKTVFVASSADVGRVQSGSGTGHAVEFETDSSGHILSSKPGFAVTDVSLNPSGSVIVTQSGYYSGGVLYSKTFDPAKLTNHTIYVQGGNVRVHGDLQSAGLTVVANQAESWNGNPGGNFQVTAPNGSAWLDNTNCVAKNPNIPQSENSILYAQRTDSSVGGTSSAGVNYWIPNTNVPAAAAIYVNGALVKVPPSTGTAGMQRSSTPCDGTPCLYDGQYYDSSGNVVGEHVDDVNGRPVVPICASDSAGCTAIKSVVDSNGNVTEMDYPHGKFEYTGNAQWTMQCTDTACDSLLSNAMYAPPPQYNADGTPVKDASGYAGGNTFAGPTVVHLYDSSGNPVATKTLAAYPGDENLATYQGVAPDYKGDPSTYEVFSSRQLADSEGNLTIAGDTVGNSLGLVAQNYVFVNDMMARAKSGHPATQIQADVASFSKSVQWEGNLNTNGSASPQDYYMNGDYAAINQGISDGYFTASGAFVSGKGHSYDGAPLMVPGITQFVDPLTPNSGQTSWASGWRLNFTGSIYAPYADVVNVMDSNGNLAGYEYENVNLNRYSSGPTPSFPQFSFTNWQNLDFTVIYPTVFYRDMGAPHV